MVKRAVIGWLAILTVASLSSCTTSRLVTQQSNPDYVGKPFKTVMVVGVAADDIVRRTFEDRVVALLDKRGVKGIAGYSMLPSRRQPEEAQLRAHPGHFERRDGLRGAALQQSSAGHCGE